MEDNKLLEKPLQDEHEIPLFYAELELEALHYAAAAETGNQNDCHYAFQNNPHIDIPMNASGQTALCLAVANQNTDLLLCLLPLKVNMQPTLRNAQLPLHCAAELGNLVIVELLLAYEADIHAVSLGHTALDKAASAAVASVLIDAGMFPMELNNALLWKAIYGGKNASNVVSVILREGGFVDAVDGQGWTAIKWACKRGDGDMVTVLAEAGAKVDAECVKIAKQHGHLEVVKFLKGLVKKE